MKTITPHKLDILYGIGINITSIEERYSESTTSLLEKQRMPIDKIESLTDLSIGAVLDIGRAKLPSEIIDIIKNDLNLYKISEGDLCKFYVNKWKNSLEDIMKQFSNMNSINIPSKYTALWKQACDRVPIAPEITMIDQIARRMHCSWEEASRIKWSEAVLMQMIDQRQSLFEHLVNEQSKKSSK